MNGGDKMQLQSAAVLYERDWRYHIEKRVWLTKVPGVEPKEKMQTYEKGVYMVFDVAQWKRVQMEMTVEYNKLAEKPLNYLRPM
jgi:CCR4-NOT transcription complex subunit 2